MGPKTQLVTVKSGTPILPATAKSLTQGNMVKISLPPAQQLIRTISAGSSVSGSTKAQRAILPSPISTSSNETSQNSRILPHSETKVFFCIKDGRKFTVSSFRIKIFVQES